MLTTCKVDACAEDIAMSMKQVAILAVAVICCATNATAQNVAEVSLHNKLSLQYAREGRKADAQAERVKAINAFEAALKASSPDLSVFLNASCNVLIQQRIDNLKEQNSYINEMRGMMDGMNNQRAVEKLCPLAEKDRALVISYSISPGGHHL